MSRVAGQSFIELEVGDLEELAFFEVRHLQAADPETLERLFAQLQAEMLARGLDGFGVAKWRLVFLDLAGAGDGHVFTCSSVWVDTEEIEQDGSVPPPPGLLSGKLFFFMGSAADALNAARKEAQKKVAARFDEDTTPPVGQVIEQQTLLAGAQQGTRFMGAVLTVTAQAPA